MSGSIFCYFSLLLPVGVAISRYFVRVGSILLPITGSRETGLRRLNRFVPGTPHPACHDPARPHWDPIESTRLDPASVAFAEPLTARSRPGAEPCDTRSRMNIKGGRPGRRQRQAPCDRQRGKAPTPRPIEFSRKGCRNPGSGVRVNG